MQVSSYATALSSYRQSTAGISKYMEQMSTGKMVNSAADNPAYLVILQGMIGQDNGYQQAYRNTQDTISLLNVSEGAMSDTADIMGDMRELSVEAANGTLTDQDRSYIQMEMDQLSGQINANASSTNFNGIYTNNGSLSGFTAQVGPNAGQSVSFSIGSLSAQALGINSDVSTQAGAENSLSAIDSAQQQLSSSQSQAGALINSLEHEGNSILAADSNIQAAEATMGDTDMASALTGLKAEQIKQYASIYAMKKNLNMQKGAISLLA